MLSKSNSFHLLRHIHAVIAQKKNNLACSNWRAAFTSLLHIALQLYGAFGKSLSFSAIAFFFIEQDMQWFWLCPKPLIRNLLTWLSWNGRIFSSSSSLFLHLFFHPMFLLVFSPSGCQEKTATRLTKASDPDMARPNEASLSLLGSQELRSSVVSVLLSLIPGTPRHRWALVLIVCLSRGRRSKLALSRPRVVPVLQYLRVRPTPTTGGYV